MSAAEQVIARLRASAKYRDVHPETIADLVRREHHGDGTIGAAELERRVRLRLHKVAALHLSTARPAGLRRGLGRTDLADPASRKEWCRQVLGSHFSTAERLPDLEVFYPTVLGLVPPPDTIVDLACAMNPFTLPWLRDVTEARYIGYDFNATFVSLASTFLARTYPDCEVSHADILTGAPLVRADLALLLKTYHCIEGRESGAGLRLVDRLECDHIVVSFPTRAMNGRAAVFSQQHVDALTALARDRRWAWSRTALPTEELIVIRKRS
ncbi:hypothetical protein JQS43_21650 [Natronosporangium hydrolyticum]|uniref:16S rRNA (guanine(1405)-N(7))-methyltransferase n=1 Tax=Natronosporangium hydrolyticum TaxID=2811111 RepID=A0A895YJX7_9ACTN|nr:hypothetical protein [Natronosporangium hydrolyticum]QSB14108.1 hypothetical protein JQS43_21650 [Natronosporangium hydrolyticum]